MLRSLKIDIYSNMQLSSASIIAQIFSKERSIQMFEVDSSSGHAMLYWTTGMKMRMELLIFWSGLI